MKLKTLLLIAAAVLVAGCSSNRGTQSNGSRRPTAHGRGPMMGPMMQGSQGSNSEQTFKSNGQRIYYTATSSSQENITATGGPHWFQMHGGSCVDCHGPDGKGGYSVPMTDVTAPDITYIALTSREHKMHGGEEHPPYTDALIKRAITKGIDPADKPLSYAMPRWNMSDSDLNDVIAYLKTLGDRESK